jgi:hypothetical protein
MKNKNKYTIKFPWEEEKENDSNIGRLELKNSLSKYTVKFPKVDERKMIYGRKE